MSLTEWVPLAAAFVAIAATLAGIIRDRRKPELDSAQAESAIVNSSSVKLQIKKMSDESNNRRDLRILDLENWGDDMRAWGREVRATFDKICDLMREDRRALNLEMPEIHLSEPPEFPPPRPLG